jgi:hypothetical protein
MTRKNFDADEIWEDKRNCARDCLWNCVKDCLRNCIRNCIRNCMRDCVRNLWIINENESVCVFSYAKSKQERNEKK